MGRLARISELISDIYDAALDVTAWPQVLRRALAVLDGASAILFARDLGQDANSFECLVGAGAHGPFRAIAHRLQLDRLSGYEGSLPVGAVFAASDALPVEQCHIDFVGTVLERSADSRAGLYISRHPHQGSVDRRARRLMRLLAPHFRQALRIGKLLDSSIAGAAAFSEALDCLAIGALVVDGAGRLTHANRAGLQRLAEGDVVHWFEGLPRPRDPFGAARVRALLDTRFERRPAPAAPEEIGSPVAVAGSAGERVTLQVLPLRGGSARRSARTAVATLLIAQQAPDLVQRVREAARRYGLTPAEARVVQALMSGCTIERGARRLGIRPATVKTHLQHVFDKTAARRQVDLIKLITEHAPPS